MVRRAVSSPEVTTSGIVSLSLAIAEAHRDIPNIIYVLFEKVIRARRAAYDFWTDVCHNHPHNKTVQKSNEGHLAYINALNYAFEALGGLKWRKDYEREQEARRKKREADRVETVASNTRTRGLFKFENKFAALEVSIATTQEEAALETLAKETSIFTSGTTTPNAAAVDRQKDSKANANGKRSSISIQPLENYKIKSETESYFAICFFLRDFLKFSRYVTSNDISRLN